MLSGNSTPPKRGRTRIRQGVGVTRTLDRGLALLETLSNNVDMSLSQLAREVGMTPTTASRLLETLKQRGFVLQTEAGLFAVGSKAMIVGSAFMRANRLGQFSSAPMAWLAGETGKTVSLGVRDGDAVIFVEQIEGEGTIQARTRVGRRLPLHATAAGKALLCGCPEAIIDALLGPGPYPRLTANTIADRSDLLQVLAKVRAQGWSIDNQEFESDVCCVAAPIRDRRNMIVAALSVSLLARNYPCPSLAVASVAVVTAAADVSMKLGWQPGLSEPVAFPE